MPEPRPDPRAVFAQAGPQNWRQGARALQDWGRGLEESAKTRAQRSLGSSPAEDSFVRPGAPTAIVLPGVWEAWEALEAWARALHAVGWSVRVVPALDQQLGTLPRLAGVLSEWLRENDLRNVLVVAHSKGGLVTKQTMIGVEGWRIRQLISLGTPYEGAPLAALSPKALGMRDLLPGTPDLAFLQTQIHVNPRIVAIQAQWDQNVPADPTLPGATLVTVAVAGHNALLTAPEAIALIVGYAGLVSGAPRLQS